MNFPAPRKYTAEVSSKEQIADNIYLVTFTLENPEELQFIAGQCMMIHIANTTNRAMSIASPPSDSHNLLMCHDVSPMGPGSKWTLGLNVGDKASVVAPIGRFVLDTESLRRKVMLATGTGVVPFRSMIMDYLEKGGKDDITLYWGLRFEKDVYWKDEFEKLAQTYSNFHFVMTLSKPTETWVGHRGRVTDHIFVHEQNVPGSDFYLCGSRAMVLEMKEKLTTKSVPKEQIRTELFF